MDPLICPVCAHGGYEHQHNGCTMCACLEEQERIVASGYEVALLGSL